MFKNILQNKATYSDSPRASHFILRQSDKYLRTLQVQLDLKIDKRLVRTFYNLFNVILSLHEMFADPDNAMKVYSAYKKTYKKFGGDSISTTDKAKFGEFFKF